MRITGKQLVQCVLKLPTSWSKGQQVTLEWRRRFFPFKLKTGHSRTFLVRLFYSTFVIFHLTSSTASYFRGTWSRKLYSALLAIRPLPSQTLKLHLYWNLIASSYKWTMQLFLCPDLETSELSHWKEQCLFNLMRLKYLGTR